MKRLYLLLSLAVSSFSYLQSQAQSGYPCPPNIDLETGTTNGWSGFYGGGDDTGGVSFTLSQAPLTQSFITTPYSGFYGGRHLVTNAGMGTDPYGGFPMVGYGSASWKLGADSSSYRAQRLQYTFTIPANAEDYSINFGYAVVLQDGGTSHQPYQQSRFTISLIDAASGSKLKDGCYDLNFVADASIPGFFTSSNNSTVRYKPWTPGTINLTGAEGKTIIMDIVSGGCSQGGHWGYGYFDVIGCDTFKARVKACNLDEEGVTIKAPEGYMNYDVWNQNYTTHLMTAHTETFAFHPITDTPQRYNVVLTPFPSVNSCPDTVKTDPISTFSLTVPDSICALDGQQIQLNANAQGGRGSLSYLWTESNPGGTLSCNTCTDPVAQTPVSNQYIVRVVDELGCYRHDTSTVYINDESFVDATDDFVLCHPGYVDLNVEPSGIQPLTPVTCGLSADPACSDPLAIEVRSLHRDNLFKRDTSSFVNPMATRYSSSHTQFLLKKEDMYFYGLKYGRLSSIAFDIFNPGVGNLESMTISLSCTDRTSMDGGYTAGTLVPVYTSAGSVNPTQGWNKFTFNQPYNWDTAQNLIVDICMTNATTDSPSIVMQMINTGSNDMFVQTTRTTGADVCNGSTPEETNTYNGRPSVLFDYCYSNPDNFQYAWIPGIYVSDSTAKTTIAYVPDTRDIMVKSHGRNGCPIYDTVTITVPIRDYEIFPKDTSVCHYEPFQLIAGGTGYTGVQWYDYDETTNTFTVPTTLSCNGCADPNKIPNPIATPRLDTSKYAVVYTDIDNCTDTLYMDYEIRPLPPVRIINNDTIIKYGTDIMLLAMGGYLYTWTPSATLSNSNVVNPTASPLDPTMYYVYGIGENGCKKIDSVMVNIDYGSNLFVPTAFTPNGDGKNDVFRVSNVTFQRLQEFRVFNRWGQELFNTNDIRKGWDGSWRGQPQDMGVYQYIIRLSVPDGKVETYKGDVMLVR